MNKFKSLSKKDKAEYIAIILLYPFFMLFSALGKSLKLFGTKKRQITASVLSFAMILTMLPVMSLTAFAATPSNPTSWSDLQAKINAGGEIKLTQDIVAGSGDAQLNVPSTSTVTIDLNGYKIDRNLTTAVYSGCVFYINRGNLTIADTSTAQNGQITGGKSTDDCGGVFVYKGTFTMTGGNIVGNTANVGGGVYNSSGTFTMNGGNIVGNKAETGGGVNNYGYSPDFTMNGGSIRDNTARDNGGGVHITYGTFTMSGGSITGNIASKDGGGAYLMYGEAFMNGGSITGNTATNGGGGVYNYSGTFNVSGSATVKDNTLKDGTTTSNVYLPSNKSITVTGALSGEIGVTTEKAPTATSPVTVTKADSSYTLTETDAAKLVSDEFDYDCVYDSSSKTMQMKSATIAHPTSWSELQTAIDAGGKIKLTQDIVAESTDAQLNVPNGKTATIDLNGYKINRNLTTAVDNGSVFYINGGNLTINDTSTTDVSKQGKITGGSDLGSAGGVYMDINGSTFTMNGGNIVGNRATSTYASGGGVYAGGVACKFTMNGGSITGNTASYQGGGVYSYSWFSVSGNATIKDNTLSGGKVDNVCLGKKGLINVLGALSGEIGINTELTNYPVTVAQASTDPAYTLTASDVAKLTSDVDGYEAVLSGDVAVLQKQALYTVAGDAGLTGVAWNPAKNSMTHGEYTFDNSAYDYAITFADVAASTYSFKVTDGTMSNAWGDNGSNYTFNLTDTCPVTIYFNSDTKKIAVGAQYLDHFTLYAITAVGNGDGTWLNGVAWDVTDPSNDMTEIEPGVFQITYKDIAASTNYQVKFMANHAWTYYWTSDEIFKGDANPKIIVARDGSTITLTIDVNGFDFEKSTGSVKVDVKVTPPEPLTLSADNFTYTAPTDLTYNGTAKTATVIAKSGVDCGTITAVKYYDKNNTLVASPTDAGTYTVKIEVAANDNYKAATDLEVGTFTITAKALTKTDLTVTDLDDEIYTGNQITPVPTVKYGDVTLEKDTDYTLSYGTNTAIGRGNVTINLKGNYSGSAQYEFDIAYGTATTAMYTVTAPNTNNWYNSSIIVSAVDGYSIGKTATGFANSISLTEETANGSKDMYLKAADGKIYKGTFTYKLDKTAPTDIKIQYNNNGFKSFLNKITFGLFFKETVNVEATASDTLSGVDTIQYYAADSAVADTSTITDWKNSLSFTQNSKKIVYVKVTDNAGNSIILLDQGVVKYSDSTVSPTNATFDKNTEEQKDIDITLNLNDNTLREILRYSDTGHITLEKNIDYTVSGNTVTIKKDYFDIFTSGTVQKLIFVFNPMGVINDVESTAMVDISITDTTHYHSGTHHAREEATCTADGNVEYWSCSCGKYFSNEACTTPITNIILTRLGHDFTEKIVDAAHLKSAATCTSPAVYYYDCSRCDEISTTETFTDGEALGHSFGTEWQKDADNHWHCCTRDSCSEIDGKAAHKYSISGTVEKGTLTPATYFANGSRTDTCVCGATNTVVLPKLIDKTAPTATMTIGENTWNTLLNSISFGLFFKDTQTVTVTANDNNESGVDKTYYYLASTETSDFSGVNWTEFTNTFSISPNNKYVVYVRVTDKVGNEAIINSDGIVLENIVPQISAENGKTYCAAVEVTVTDDNLDTVTLDGNAVTLTNGKFTVSPQSGAQTIVATDLAGNSTTVTITVNDGHTWDDGAITKPATTEEKGEKTFTCKLCGATKTEAVDMLPPSMTEKTDKYVQGGETGMTFKSNAALSDLESVSVDGKVLDEKDYDKQSGSTIVTLKPAYLETLSVGKHTIDIKSTTGTASAEFTIEAKAADPIKPGDTTSPQTGDNNNMILWIALLFVSGGVLGTLGLTKRRRKQNKK